MNRVKAMSSPGFRPGWPLAAYAAFLAVGVLCAFHPTLLSGGARLQTDPGDTILNHYILEHSWLWLSRPGYVGTLWSPPCFYPTPLTLAYSENLLGTAPLYWTMRPVLKPPAAYAAWMIGVCVLTFAAAAWALRRFGMGHVLAAFGAFVFAFGLPRSVGIGHQQLLPHLFAPLAVCAAWSLAMRPRLRTLAGLLAACFLQTLSSIYLGWFLMLALAIFVPLLLATQRGVWPRLFAFARRSWLPSAGLAAATAILFGLLLNVYVEANQGFVREWEECAAHVPTRVDWLLPPPVAASAHALGVDCGSTNVERWCFLGWLPMGLVVLGVGAALGRPALLGEQARLILALLGTALALAVLSTDFGGGTLWRFVYEHVPGATAIRAVGRVATTALFFVLAGGLLSLDRLLRTQGAGVRAAIVTVLLLLGTAEQVDRELYSFDVDSFYPRAEALGAKLQPGNAAYVVSRSEDQWYTGELVAMWAGLYGNQRMVNGYSGREPDRYPGIRLGPGIVFGWLKANAPFGQMWQGRLLYVMPVPQSANEYRTVLLEATR